MRRNSADIRFSDFGTCSRPAAMSIHDSNFDGHEPARECQDAPERAMLRMLTCVAHHVHSNKQGSNRYMNGFGSHTHTHTHTPHIVRIMIGSFENAVDTPRRLGSNRTGRRQQISRRHAASFPVRWLAFSLLETTHTERLLSTFLSIKMNSK